MVTVSIKRDAGRFDIWRLTFDGRILGDSRGYSRLQAERAAADLVRRSPDLYRLGA